MRVGSLVALKFVRNQGFGVVLQVDKDERLVKVVWGGNFIGWAYSDQLEVLCE